MPRAVDQDQTRDKRQETSEESRKEKVKKTTEADNDASSESDCEYLQQTARQVLHRAKKLRWGRTQDTVLIRIGDIDAHIATRQQSSCERDGRVPIQSPKTQIKANQRTRSQAKTH